MKEFYEVISGIFMLHRFPFLDRLNGFHSSFCVEMFHQMSRHMGKPTICMCENKDADQLRSNCEADQHLCFRYSNSTLPLLLKSEISSFWLFSLSVQLGLCRTCSETTLLCWFSHTAAQIGLLDQF